ncbi:MAG TPA: TIGR02679 family protein [Opitutaceae bacterium]
MNRLFGDKDTEPLVKTLARRLADGRPLSGTIALRPLSAQEREAIAALTGQPVPTGDTLRLDLDALAAQLRDAGISPTLEAAIVALRGPIASRRLASVASAKAWEAVKAEADRTFAACPELTEWVQHLFDLGLMRRLTGNDPTKAAALIGQLGLLAMALPAADEPLPTIAARLFGSAHSLDPGSPLATLGVRLAARLGGVRLAESAEGRRLAWSSAGVLCDELSLPVLVFNLRPLESGLLGRLLAAAADEGQPLHISARLLLRSSLVAGSGLSGTDVFVCENPTIVTLAADRLGSGCAPLVCVNGQFATPALLLLRMLRSAGAKLHVHADFDSGGLVIARRVMSEGGATPWRYGAKDYAAACKGIRLSGDLPPVPWDPELRETMLRDGRGVHEEAVADVLLRDLGQQQG